MIVTTRYIADCRQWLHNLCSYPQRQNLTQNILNVLGRSTQLIYNKFFGKISQNIDLYVTFQLDAMREWLFKYYKLESIVITNNPTNIFNTDFAGVNDAIPPDFQRTNIGGVDDVLVGVLPFNMAEVGDTIPDNSFAVNFTITGRVSKKQQADIVQFIQLRTQKRANTLFLDPTGGDILVFVYEKGSTNKLAEVDIIVDTEKNVFINGTLETEPTITNIFNVTKIISMDKVTITGNGTSKTFSSANTLETVDIICQARLQSTGQNVDCDITVSETTITVDTGAVALGSGVKLDILITSAT